MSLVFYYLATLTVKGSGHPYTKLDRKFYYNLIGQKANISVMSAKKFNCSGFSSEDQFLNNAYTLLSSPHQTPCNEQPLCYAPNMKL